MPWCLSEKEVNELLDELLKDVSRLLYDASVKLPRDKFCMMSMKIKIHVDFDVNNHV